jgi:antimicrobial peptide system SdpA family protein
VNRFLFTIACVALWGLAIVEIISAALPYNPMSPDVGLKSEIMGVTPEGWGFFTRDPREERLHLLMFLNGFWQRNPNSPISNSSNLFGINRFPRAQSVELAMLVNDPTVGDSWKNSRIDLDHIVIADSNFAVTVNPSPFPTILGKICIVRQSPIPWAWAGNVRSVAMPSQYLLLNVKRK